MADYKYLISADKAGVTTYYTANHDGIIEAIGTVADWSKGFDDISLSAINNETIVPKRNRPCAPILKKPVLYAIATDRPVKINGTV